MYIVYYGIVPELVLARTLLQLVHASGDENGHAGDENATTDHNLRDLNPTISPKLFQSSINSFDAGPRHKRRHFVADSSAK